MRKAIDIRKSDGKPIHMDITYIDSTEAKTPVVFCHGFKGFKDWGHFNVVADQFSESGAFFVKFNFSHNGTSGSHKADFVDLESFGRNNYSMELEDLNTVLDWLESDHPYKDLINLDQLTLIGHSRGGGIAILKAREDPRIHKLITWAAVSDFHQRLPSTSLDDWREKGVIYIPNSRTGQQMPMYYQFYEDLMTHRDRLSIPKAAQRLAIPALIIHGTKDEAVDQKSAEDLHSWIRGSEVLLIPNEGHTFGVGHPFVGQQLPSGARQVVEASISFALKA